MKNDETLAAKFLYRALLIALAIFLSAGSATAAWNDRQQLRSEIDQFHDYIQKHPRVSTELQNNPQLVYNKRYLSNHDDLERFLKRHPLVRQEISENPGRVFGSYYNRLDRRYGDNSSPWGWGWGWGRR
jgi:hypothetical protein